MEETLLGIDIEVRFSQDENAHAPMIETLSGMETEVRLLQEENALSPIRAIPRGIEYFRSVFFMG